MGLATGVGIGIQFSRGGGQSWESYWASQPEVLFFGLYSEISGGQMPNKVTGSSDYLTVAGVAGSETYQCPNTAPYIAADTDYIWFKTDESQRTVTTAELIGYDLQRTPVKYQDASPNEIVAIMILNAAVTGTKRDFLFRDMWLPILWDNNLNGYGHIKANRLGQQLWTPESVITFSDTFTDTNDVLVKNHTPDSANFTWATFTGLGYFKIASNKAICASTGTVLNINYFDSGGTDIDMSITLTIPDSDNYMGGLLVRVKSSTEFYRILARRASGASPELRIYKDGTVVSSVNTSHTPGDGILRTVAVGNKITVYWKGVKLIDEYETDGSYSTYTTHGIMGYEAAPYSQVIFDNFSAS